MSHHPLINFELQRYNQNESAVNQAQQRFNGFYSRNSLPKIKDGAYVINLDEYKSVGTHRMALFVTL